MTRRRLSGRHLIEELEGRGPKARPMRSYAALARYELGRAHYQPTTTRQAAARALRMARGGGTLARVAVNASMGMANDWPREARAAACRAMYLPVDDPSPVSEVLGILLAKGRVRS